MNSEYIQNLVIIPVKDSKANALLKKFEKNTNVVDMEKYQLDTSDDESEEELGNVGLPKKLTRAQREVQNMIESSMPRPIPIRIRYNFLIDLNRQTKKGVNIRDRTLNTNNIPAAVEKRKRNQKSNFCNIHYKCIHIYDYF